MAIVGFNILKPVEIAGYCEDISWALNRVGLGCELRSDMLYPSGVLHFWGHRTRFSVSDALSSMDIKLIERENHD